jgi:hypothetical protein
MLRITRRLRKARGPQGGPLTLAAALLGLAVGSGPAAGEIAKLLLPCKDGKLCAAYRASIKPPDGWRLDADAERRFNVQMLVPQGQTFDDAGAIIYAVVTYNPNNRSIADFVAEDQARWRAESADVKISALPDVARANGKPAFSLHHYELPTSTAQPFERVATTTDSDADGNGFLVGVVLSAKSMAALDAAEPAHLAILKAY